MIHKCHRLGIGPDWKYTVLVLKIYGLFAKTKRSFYWNYAVSKSKRPYKNNRSFDGNYIMTIANFGESGVNELLYHSWVNTVHWTAINLKYDVTVFRIWLGVEMFQQARVTFLSHQNVFCQFRYVGSYRCWWQLPQLWRQIWDVGDGPSIDVGC